jgi:hypothetical protein
MRALDVQAGDYVTFQITEDGTVQLRKLLLTVAPLHPSMHPRP